MAKARLTYLSVANHTRVPFVELVEKNVDVGVRQHQSARQVVPRHEPVALPLLVFALKQTEGLLDVEVRVLQQQLSLLFNDQLRLQKLLPKSTVQDSCVLSEHLLVCLLIL